mgnify:CR=1 FL=1
MTKLFTFLGGRKMTLSLAGLASVVLTAKFGGPEGAYMPIALIVASFAGANGWVESAYAKKVPRGD